MFELLEIFSEDEMKEKRNYFQIYVPTSIILMSQFSYFDVLKDCVSKWVLKFKLIKNLKNLQIDLNIISVSVFFIFK